MKISLFLPLIISLTGLYLLVKLRFFFILHPIKTAKEFLIATRDRASRKALFLALAGTLGVGNIFGVAAGMMIGGEGCLFWIFISSVFSMVIKYAETLLVFDSLPLFGGMSGAFPRVFKKHGKSLGKIYAALTVILALFMGCGIQSAALFDLGRDALSVPTAYLAPFLLLLIFPCIRGGARKIENITEIIIPLTTIIYIIMCFAVILLNFDRLPTIIFRCVSSAFSKEAIVGGGAVIAIREGFSRGILSNEAGVGTSALAHSRAENREPRVAGLFGVCEVFFDTTLLCTLTGLVILLLPSPISGYSTPMSLVNASFSSALGSWSGVLLLLLIFAFAYSTIICWYYYGLECTGLYFPRFKAPFIIAFALSLLFSGCLPQSFLLYLTDIILLLMTVMTLSAIIKSREKIVRLSTK